MATSFVVIFSANWDIIALPNFSHTTLSYSQHIPT